MDMYNFGRDEYLAWRRRKATDVLNEAYAIMIRNIVETGYYNMNEESYVTWTNVSWYHFISFGLRRNVNPK